MSDDREEKIINEEYKIWKKNTSFLYDLIITHALEWPSLTVEWLPEKRQHDTHSTQKLILGTHTSQSEQNYLLIAEAELPINNSDVDIRRYDSSNGESGSLGTSMGKGKVECVQRINHEGEVNRARYMPQHPEYIATKCVNGQVLIFKYTEFESVPKTNQCTPTLRLKGHTQEGYGVCWSTKKEGLIASGSDDCKVCIWDIFAQQGQIDKGSLQPFMTLEGHSAVVEDVAWHRIHDFLLGTVCDDKNLRIFDTRAQSNTKPSHVTEAHRAEVNSIDFSPYSEYVLATGSADKTVKLWDMRNLKSELHTLNSHTDEVFSVSWSPSNETILASCGTDRRVMIWDISRIGMEQTPEDAEDGPPELLFIHGGHTSKISDFSWNPNEGDEWVIASVAEDNILQIWQPSDSIYLEDDNENVADSDLQ
ncbi:hypothetical protein C9374_000163 [Naegleria lovaniensis]|uniref:Guanine nucleotide-binding protein subunit beta-like protein n=1 Tax=Naegleria lovaniensis TaxID=51637 RepID=A0AA88GZ99_NAELO|nr:uncharacterized protein C9374_000163 [Naegleria lovaniensis]KAG2388724.1 hypothetical protein C9374_000163 [Naegleria lovaniensis]